MVVLSVAYPFAAVAPDPIGGAEQVVASIDARLVREGHASIVLAASGSRAAGQVVRIPPSAGWIDAEARTRARETYRVHIARICAEHAIDVVHYHGHDFAEYAPELALPQIATLHLPPSLYATDPGRAAGVARVCVSRTQRRAFSPRLEIADVIENGIAVERYRPAGRKGGFVLALGRICPEKGFELALDAARRAGLPLVLAGGVFPYETHHRYATRVIAPSLDADRRWIGPVTGERKRRLLAEARCLAITSLVDETSSLVAMEALASGTPVVALARGALPEIVEHGVTGLLVEDPAGLPDALARAGGLSARACRASACARFSADRMTARYLELYGRHARARPRRAAAPISISVATRDAELAGLAGEWDALCDRCPSATVFQRPAWLLAWLRRFGEGGELRAAILRRGGRLVGLVPLELRGGVLRLIGEGISDYLDAIVEPDLGPRPVGDAIARAARGARSLELAALRPCSVLRELALGGGIWPSTPSPVVALDGARPPPRAAYEARRLARLAPRWHDETGGAASLLDGLFELHRARWAARGQGGALAGLEGFHREVATAMLRRGLLRLIGFSTGGALRAVLYGFADHGRFWYYLSGFDPTLARLSPGRLLIARALERARDEGAFELDFLRGREPYKYEWGAVDRSAAIYRAELPEEDRHARDSMDPR